MLSNKLMKKYYEKYLAEGKEIYLIGIHFDSTKRNISEFEWRRIDLRKEKSLS
jgi:hypothetical protein